MSRIITSPVEIDRILDRGVIVEILPSKEEFRELLLSGQRIRIYLGIDPTSTSLHLGHAKNFMLLEEFRQLGHEVIVVIGDFTARIGDPSGRSEARKVLADETIAENTRKIAGQIERLLDFKDKDNPALIRRNNEWLGKLSFGDVIGLARNFTVQQMLERDMFAKRQRENKPISLSEFLYPLIQGYDSVALEVDAEVGGTDQTFNMLAGRTLLKRTKDKEKFVVVVNLPENPKTGEIMSKSRGVGVFLDVTPKEMFGQIMALGDEMVRLLLINNTRLDSDEVERLARAVSAGGEQAMEAKLRTADEIVTTYHSAEKASEAREEFIRTFSRREPPRETGEYSEVKPTIMSALLGSGLAESKSEARRLIKSGAVELDNVIKYDPDEKITRPSVLKVGKKKFIRVVPK